MRSHPAQTLDHLESTVMVDLQEVYDPRSDEFLTLLGMEVLYHTKRDLSFLASSAPRHLGPGFMNAFVRLGGYPRLLEVPPRPPFAKNLGDTVIPNPELLALAHACDFGLSFPELFILPELFGRGLPTTLSLVMQKFLPTRGPESLEARNKALRKWVSEGCRGEGGELW